MPRLSAGVLATKERLGQSSTVEDPLDRSSFQTEITSRKDPASLPGAMKLNGHTRPISENSPMNYRRFRVEVAFASIVGTLQETLPEGTNLTLWGVLSCVAILEFFVGNWLVWQAVASLQILK